MKSKRKMEDLKGTMSHQVHAHVDKKHFKMVGPTFSNAAGGFGKLFSSV